MYYENSIDELINSAEKYKLLNGHNPYFISDWNPADENIEKIILKNSENIHASVNKYNYLYSIDDIGYKSVFENFCCLNGLKFKFSSFSLFSNATISLYTIFKLLKTKRHKNVLAFTPCYFTNESALLSLDFNMFYYPDFIDLNNNNLEKALTTHGIDCILITDPIFGIGTSYTIEKYQQILSVCKKYFVSLIIDYSYGNMEWVNPYHIANFNLLKILDESKVDYYMVESLPKRLFLNGVKFALLFSHTENIDYLEHLALFIEGSITAEQVKCYYTCYASDNIKVINNAINGYAQKAMKTYNILRSFLLDYSAILLNADSGIFATVGIPRTNPFDKDLELAKNLIKQYGVFLIPHTRYHYFDKSYFYFRVNLLLEQDLLITTLSKILKK